MLNDARSRTAASADAPHAAPVLQELGLGMLNTSKRYIPGQLQMLQLLRERAVTLVRSGNVLAELVYDARPASGQSPVHHVHILFRSEEDLLPAPELDLGERRLKLYYPANELERLRNLLRSRKDRLCYFWQGATPARVHAWLFTSR
ncbi:MAG: hypothetical protein QM724_02220 [Flavobacteriales bacterium]